MSKIYIMRRANGQFFTILPNRVAIWTNQELLEISRAYNRELDLYQALPLTGKLVQELKDKFTIQGNCIVWSVEPKTSLAPLSEGRLLDWAELETLLNQPDSEPPKVETPKVRATIQEFQFS
ncbi:MAG: hypothetical protein HY819_16500 [Acidobacteria bacterium]|nr:hypothetical protein [Acidobacteriota bacterium]